MLSDDIKLIATNHQHYLDRDVPNWEQLRADFSNQNLRDSNFSGYNWSHAIFSGADCRGCVFLDCMLYNADFTDAKLAFSDFTNANMSHAVFKNASMHDIVMKNATCQDTDLSHLNLTHSDIKNCNLTGSDLSWAVLDNADLSRSTLAGVNFRHADLTNTYLLDTDMRDADISFASIPLSRPYTDKNVGELKQLYRAKKPMFAVSLELTEEFKKKWEKHGFHLSYDGILFSSFEDRDNYLKGEVAYDYLDEACSLHNDESRFSVIGTYEVEDMDEYFALQNLPVRNIDSYDNRRESIKLLTNVDEHHEYRYGISILPNNCMAYKDGYRYGAYKENLTTQESNIVDFFKTKEEIQVFVNNNPMYGNGVKPMEEKRTEIVDGALYKDDNAPNRLSVCILMNEGAIKDVKLFQNIENGNIGTFSTMMQEAVSMYDVGDDTNVMSFMDYYKPLDDTIRAFEGIAQDGKSLLQIEDNRLLDVVKIEVTVTGKNAQGRLEVEPFSLDNVVRERSGKELSLVGFGAQEFCDKLTDLSLYLSSQSYRFDMDLDYACCTAIDSIQPTIEGTYPLKDIETAIDNLEMIVKVLDTFNLLDKDFDWLKPELEALKAQVAIETSEPLHTYTVVADYNMYVVQSEENLDNNFSCVLDILMDNLEEMGMTFPTFEELERDGVGEDCYVIGGNSGNILLTNGNFNITKQESVPLSADLTNKYVSIVSQHQQVKEVEVLSENRYQLQVKDIYGNKSEVPKNCVFLMDYQKQLLETDKSLTAKEDKHPVKDTHLSEKAKSNKSKSVKTGNEKKNTDRSR